MLFIKKYSKYLFLQNTTYILMKKKDKKKYKYKSNNNKKKEKFDQNKEGNGEKTI